MLFSDRVTPCSLYRKMYVFPDYSRAELITKDN